MLRMSRSLLLRSLGQRAMSTRVVAHVVGPDRVGILKEVTKVIGSVNANIGDTRASTVGGLFSVSTVLDMPGDSAELSYKLQTALPEHITMLRPESCILESTAPVGVFGKIEIVHAPSMGTISTITDHIASRSINFATLRTTETDTKRGTEFTATATLSTSGPVDVKWIEKELIEISNKMAVDIKFSKLDEEAVVMA